MARGKGAWWDLPVTILIALVVVLAVTRFIAQPFVIPSGSMESTLEVGDRVVVNKLTYHARPIERGDVVVFDGTDSFVPASQVPDEGPLSGLGRLVGIGNPAGTDFVKRVIVVGGDRVACCDAQGRVTVNGTPLDESSYLYAGDAPSLEPFDVEVPQGMLWVMGDHRSDSADSRAHLGDPGGGMVPVGRVVGRASVIVFPPSRMGVIPIPDAFAAVSAP